MFNIQTRDCRFPTILHRHHPRQSRPTVVMCVGSDGSPSRRSSLGAMKRLVACHTLSPSSAKNISVRAEWLHQSGRAPSEPSETPRWRITPCPASIPRVALHIALRSPFRRFFSLCWSPILNKQSGVVANCDHMLEWVHWVHACIRIAMQWVTLRKSLLAFLLH